VLPLPAGGVAYLENWRPAHHDAAHVDGIETSKTAPIALGEA